MNAKQKLHQLHLQQWADRFQDQASSGLSVKDWCTQNNLSIHNYYYWKRILKEQYVDSVLPDIVPILPPAGFSGLQEPAIPSPDSEPIPVTTSFCSSDLHDLHNSYNQQNYNYILIRCNGLDISLSPDVSYDTLAKVIKAVRHA